MHDNDTTTHIPDIECTCNEHVTPTTDSHVELDAFIYIVVVVVLYATSITFLLIRYGRNYDEEKDFKYHYSEFVKRDRFRESQYRNKIALDRTKQHLENAKCGNSGSSVDLKQEHIGYGVPLISYSQNEGKFKCPVITITSCSEDSLSIQTESYLRSNSPDSEKRATANSRYTVPLLNYPIADCDRIEMDFLKAPNSSGDEPGELARSYDSGVDYLGNHACLDDVAVCEWTDESGNNDRHQFRHLSFKSNMNKNIATNFLTIPRLGEIENRPQCTNL